MKRLWFSALLLCGAAHALEVEDLEDLSVRVVPGTISASLPFLLELSATLPDGCDWSIESAEVDIGRTDLIEVALTRSDTPSNCTGRPGYRTTAIGPLGILLNLGARRVDLEVLLDGEDLALVDLPIVSGPELPDVRFQPGLYFSFDRPGNALALQTFGRTVFGAMYAFEGGMPTWKTIQGTLRGGLLETTVDVFAGGPEFPLDTGATPTIQLVAQEGPIRLYPAGPAELYLVTGDDFGAALRLEQFSLAYLNDDDEGIGQARFFMPDLTGLWLFADPDDATAEPFRVSWERAPDEDDGINDISFIDRAGGNNLRCTLFNNQVGNIRCEMRRSGGTRFTFPISGIGTHRIIGDGLIGVKIESP